VWMVKILAFLRLARPANIVTAIADIWAGFAIVGAVPMLFGEKPGEYWDALLWLTLSTIGLYGGGVAFNDIFDAELDAKERPERPIPSGQIRLIWAVLFASLLMIGGIACASQVSLWSGQLAVFITVFALVYDAWGKHRPIFGPINMGACRSANLVLGMTAYHYGIGAVWYVALIPLVYIAAITMISRGEVHGKNKKALMGGMGMYLLITSAIIAIALAERGIDAWESLPFIALFGIMIYPPLWKAIRKQEPALIGKAVKSGVIALIILNAALASAFAGILPGMVIIFLLPLSLWLAKIFAVT
jgi:4-hydroxybenzoate polyprenyltransferase